MPWLAELVHSSEGSLDVLPVQCLCEFLLLEKTGDNGKEQDEGFSKEMQDKRVVCNYNSHFFVACVASVSVGFSAARSRRSPQFSREKCFKPAESRPY